MDPATEEITGGKHKKSTGKGRGRGRGRGTGKGGCDGCGTAAGGGKKSRSASPSRVACATKKPKRKLSPYNIFIKSAYARLKKLHPNASAPEIMKKAAAEWQSKK